MSLTAIALAVSVAMAADTPPDANNPTVPSGPVAGTELPIIKAERAHNSACIHCAMT